MLPVYECLPCLRKSGYLGYFWQLLYKRVKYIYFKDDENTAATATAAVQARSILELSRA